MKKYFFLCLILLTAYSSVFSQTWYPVGAKWYFNNSQALLTPNAGYNQYTVEKDTVVEGRAAKKISIIEFSPTGSIETDASSPIILHEENSKVYYLTDNEFHLMYDFNLEQQDTLNIELELGACDSISPIIIDSLSSITFGSKMLKIQYASCHAYNSTLGIDDEIQLKITESIGVNDRFILNTNFCYTDQWTYAGLRCYTDNEIYYKSDKWLKGINEDYACDSIVLITGIEGATKNDFQFYPNPTTTTLHIELPNTAEKIEVYNMLGTLVNSYETKSKKMDINIAHLQNGVYLFAIKLENGNVLSYKIIKK